MKGQCVDREYWAVVTDTNDWAWHIRRTKTEVIKACVGDEPGYQKRWRKMKKWSYHPRIVRVEVVWNGGAMARGGKG
jgi:hypothetical protein